MSTNCSSLGSLMKLISSGQDLAPCAQVDALFEALQVSLSSVHIGILLLDQSFQRLGDPACVDQPHRLRAEQKSAPKQWRSRFTG